MKICHQPGGLAYLASIQIHPVGQLATLERLKANSGVNIAFEYLLRSGLRHFFDFRTSGFTGHHHKQAAGGIDKDTEIEFPCHIASLFHQDLAHRHSFRSGLTGHHPSSNQLARRPLCFLWIIHYLYTTRLAPSPGIDLGFDYHLVANLSSYFSSFSRGGSHFASGHRNTVLSQKRLGLVFMDLQSTSLFLEAEGVGFEHTFAQTDG